MALTDGKTQQEYYDSGDYGGYQFVSLDDIINQFMAIYVGQEKIISKASRVDVAFHAQRAVQELSFDTFKSIGSQELEVPDTLNVPLPHDYVNYTQISWIDGSGIKHRLYPVAKTSNPTNPYQNSDKEFSLTAIGDLVSTSNDIVLDGEYKNIKVGMVVTGPYIPANTIVSATANASSVTTITITDRNDNVVEPTETNTNTKLTFYNATDGIVNGDLVLQEKESYIVESLSWNTTDYKITASSADDITDIKIGMLVSHDNFPIGTTVTNVDSTTIVTSHLPDTVVSSGGEVTFISPETKDSTTWANYQSNTPSENNNYDYEDDVYWPLDGERYGLDPQHAQINGSFYIDEKTGKIHFSSNMSGKTVTIDYISDGLYTERYGKSKFSYKAPLIHKFAEEAIYKWIAYSIVSGRTNIPEVIVQRLKRERFAETRKAKLRLSNIKLEELTQILRGKSKWIKH